MEQIINFFKTLANDEEGVTVIEYALLAVLIIIVAIAMIQFVGHKVNNTFNNIGSRMPN